MEQKIIESTSQFNSFYQENNALQENVNKFSHILPGLKAKLITWAALKRK
jgi:hypothetical protein